MKVLLNFLKSSESAAETSGCGITGLDEAVQTDLFAQKSLESLEASEAAVDRIVARFGKKVIGKGREVGRKRDLDSFD